MRVSSLTSKKQPQYQPLLFLTVLWLPEILQNPLPNIAVHNAYGNLALIYLSNTRGFVVYYLIQHIPPSLHVGAGHSEGRNEKIYGLESSICFGLLATGEIQMTFSKRYDVEKASPLLVQRRKNKSLWFSKTIFETKISKHYAENVFENGVRVGTKTYSLEFRLCPEIVSFCSNASLIQIFGQ